MTYHLWCQSNSQVDDFVHLHLFQWTLTSAVAKWYIEFARGSYQDFNSLAMAFLTHFQLLVCYETSTHLVTSLKHDTTTHIFDHIHEWRHRHRLIKFEILDELLTKWFTKSFIKKLAADIAMGGYVTKYQAISHAQYLYLVYSQSSMLYDLFRDALRPSMDPTSSKYLDVPPVDSIIGSVSCSNKASLKQKSILNTTSNPPSKPSSNLGKTSKVNVIHSTTVDKASKGKTKCKGEVKLGTPKQDPPNSSANGASKHKPKYPFLICFKITIPRIVPVVWKLVTC